MVQIPSYLACTLVFHPETVRARSRNFPVQSCNFSKLPPFCPNDGMLAAATTYFLSSSPWALSLLHATPVIPRTPTPPTHPLSPSFSPPKHEAQCLPLDL